MITAVTNNWNQRASFVSRVSYGLVAEIGTEVYPRIEDAVSKTRRRILEWVGEQTGVPDLENRPLDMPFDEPDRPGVKFGVAVSADGSTWVAKMEKPDRSVPQRTWMTETSVVSIAGAAYVVVRNTCTAPAEQNELPRSVPRFVKRIAEIVGLFDADEPLEREHWTISSSEDVADLRALVTDPTRFLPVVLVTEPYALDAESLAKRMYGVAHVVSLPDRFSHEWLLAIGKPFNAFLGAVRTYNPGLDPETSDPYDHPLALRERIRTFATDGLSGADAFANLLIERAHANNATRITLDPRAMRYSEVRAEALEARRSGAAASNTTAEMQAIVVEEIAAYREQVREARQMQDAALEDNEVLRADNKGLEAELFRMQAEIERIRALQKREDATEPIALPDLTDEETFDENMTEFVERLAGRVLLTPRARRELRASEYGKPDQIAAGLLLLYDEFWRMKTHQLDRATFDRRCAELGFEYAGSIEERNAGDEYYVSYRGRKMFMEMALKAGTSREPRYCLRIYTFWDAERRVSVVGSLPAHLDNTLT